MISLNCLVTLGTQVERKKITKNEKSVLRIFSDIIFTRKSATINFIKADKQYEQFTYRDVNIHYIRKFSAIKVRRYYKSS